MGIQGHPLIDKLLSLGLPAEDYAVFGSGPMFAHGLKNPHDLDLIARGSAWKKACAAGTTSMARVTGKSVAFFDDAIEVFDSWGPGNWDIDKLIDRAEVINGIRFVRLTSVARWKKLMGRAKDREHVKLIETYLEKKR